MKTGQTKVVRTFTEDLEMVAWLAGSGVEDLKREYPPSKFSAKIDLISREVSVTKKEAKK